jgi:hypothetical protein
MGVATGTDFKEQPLERRRKSQRIAPLADRILKKLEAGATPVRRDFAGLASEFKARVPNKKTGR